MKLRIARWLGRFPLGTFSSGCLRVSRRQPSASCRCYGSRCCLARHRSGRPGDHVRSSNDFKFEGGRFEVHKEWKIWVLRKNYDGSHRVVIRTRSRSVAMARIAPPLISLWLLRHLQRRAVRPESVFKCRHRSDVPVSTTARQSHGGRECLGENRRERGRALSFRGVSN